MTSENIIAIIKWGPLLVFLVIFLFGLISGIIRGRRKATKHFIYSILYVGLAFFFAPKIAEFALSIEINGTSAEILMGEFISENETLNGIVNGIPGIKSLIISYPQAIISLLLFLVLVLIKPLMFPIYLVYCIFYSIISKHVFKYSKYKRDENGKILRNEKGKKIKDKKNKHRLTGGLIRGFEYTMLTSIVLMPVGVITRLYSDAKDASSNKSLSNIEYLKDFEEYLSYVDAFNDSLLGKATNSIVSEKAVGYLTTVEIEGTKTTIEQELSNIVVAAVYLEESGLIKLLSGKLDIKTLDLSKLNLNKIDTAIEMVFKSSTLKSIIADGINYILENNLKETLVNFSEDGDIINKIKYSSANEVKEELLTVTNLIRDIINSKLLTTYQGDSENVMTMVNSVKTEDVEIILNRILSIKILSRAMPSLMTKLLKDKGLKETLTQEDNNHFVDLILNVLKLAKTLEVDNINNITEGDVLNNIVNTLYKEGAIKENSLDSLAILLSDITSSNVFDDILVTQLNNLLSKYEINLNSQMLVNVKTAQDWKKELAVLEDIFELYDTYKNEEKVEFLVANELLKDLKDTKAMILAFPIAYQKLFPNIGIEVDSSKIQYIDYEDENADEEEVKFYNYWKSQLVHLEVISDELAKLRLSSFSDVSLDLLEVDANVDSMATILAEVFSMDLLKDGITNKLTEVMKDMLVNYEINLNEDAITNVNKLVDTNPYYIDVGGNEYDIEFVDNKYYINGTQVYINGDKVNYNSEDYDVENNNLARIWKRELSNLATIVKVVKTGDHTDKENLTTILNAVDDMYLLKDVKTDLLIYAVKQINIMDVSSIDKSKVSFAKEKNILLNVIDKYDMLKDIATLDFANISDDEIEDLAFVLENVLDSDIFGDYAADNVVNLAGNVDVDLDKETVKNANTWVSDLKLIRTATNMNKDSFDKATIESLLNGIESSSLLGDIKNQILLDTAKKINIQGITIPSTLTSEELVYSDEKKAILAASDNLTLLEDMSKAGFSLSSVDSDKISELLSTSIKSKMFGDSVIDTLVDVFADNSIKHDLDVSANTNLVNAIKSVDTKENWKKEIDLIKTLLEIDTKEEVNKSLFDTIEDPNQTKLLSGCRANLLLRMIKEIDKMQPDLDLNSDIDASYLVNGGTYSNYNIERDVLIDLVTLTDIEGIDSVNASTKDDMADMLNNMKNSTVFSNSYDDIVSDITSSMSTNSDLTDWGLVVETSPTIDDWNVELTSLLTVKDNASEINEMTLETIDTQLIGNTLDELDKSSIISGSENAANNIVKQLMGNEASISKGASETWKDAFENKFGE